MTIKLTSSFGMDHSLWDTLSIKMSHFIKKGVVLDKNRSFRTSCQCCCLIVHRVTMAGCKNIRRLENGIQDNEPTLISSNDLLVLCKVC